VQKQSVSISIFLCVLLGGFMLSREMCITEEITTYNSSIMHVHM